MQMIKLALVVVLGCGPALTGFATEAHVTWTAKCVKCHGADGKGGTKMGKKLEIKDYTDAKVQAGFTDEEAIKALKTGIKDKGGSLLMKPVEGLTDAEVKALVAYVRGLKP